MSKEQVVQPFGYAEMFEWKNMPDNLRDRAGLFVQFSETEPDKIEKWHGGNTCGVTTVCFAALSDNPVEWPGSYSTTPSGGYLYEKKEIAVGNKIYDQNNEMNIMRTYPYTVHKKIKSGLYKENSEYAQRTTRPEWQAVTINGKCIVYDDGTCKPGEWCKPKLCTDYDSAGIATAGVNGDEKYYVLRRLSENTVLIIMR